MGRMQAGLSFSQHNAPSQPLIADPPCCLLIPHRHAAQLEESGADATVVGSTEAGLSLGYQVLSSLGAAEVDLNYLKQAVDEAMVLRTHALARQIALQGSIAAPTSNEDIIIIDQERYNLNQRGLGSGSSGSSGSGSSATSSVDVMAAGAVMMGGVSVSGMEQSNGDAVVVGTTGTLADLQAELEAVQGHSETTIAAMATATMDSFDDGDNRGQGEEVAAVVFTSPEGLKADANEDLELESVASVDEANPEGGFVHVSNGAAAGDAAHKASAKLNGAGVSVTSTTNSK